MYVATDAHACVRLAQAQQSTSAKFLADTQFKPGCRISLVRLSARCSYKALQLQSARGELHDAHNSMRD